MSEFLKICDFFKNLFFVSDTGDPLILTCLELQHDHVTVKPFLNGHSQKDKKIDFQDQLSLNAGVI